MSLGGFSAQALACAFFIFPKASPGCHPEQAAQRRVEGSSHRNTAQQNDNA